MDQPTVVPLNEGQKAAAKGFFEFLLGPEKELCLSGPGGVGKTFLMGHLIDEVMPRYFDACAMMGIKPEYDEVIMTATTNKAAEVLSEATKRPTSTIHAFLGLTIREDFKTGKANLIKSNSWQVHERKIIFIDESSMIDTPLRKLILEGSYKCKIVYVGDHCQLAPVMEPLSPIYLDDLPFYELTQQMRTNIQILQDTNEQLRETVKTGIFNPIQTYPGVIDWYDDAQMEAEIISQFSGQTHNNRILGYTNKRVVDYNDFIREIRELPSTFTVGELLVNNSAVRMPKGMLRVEEELEITYQAEETEFIEIDKNEDVHLEVRRTDFKNSYGALYFNIPVPVDRFHFDSLIKYYQRLKNWNRYYHLKQTYPDLRQRDAATVHKAQGSTYETVYIDMNDISTCKNPSVAARLLYVAFTRARSRVVLYGQLAEKFGGLI